MGGPGPRRGPLVRGEQAWRRPFLQLAGPLWRRQGRVDTAGKKVFLSLINHFCTGALREGHPRVTGLVLTGAPGGGRRGPGLNPGAKGRSEESRMAWSKATRPQGPPGQGISQPGCLSAEQQPSCPEVKNRFQPVAGNPLTGRSRERHIFFFFSFGQASVSRMPCSS